MLRFIVSFVLVVTGRFLPMAHVTTRLIVTAALVAAAACTPAPPKPVTIASINSIVSLFWPLSAEPDVVGYNIYRTEEESAPPEKWVKINPELHKTASFRDDHAQVGRKYFYQITAVDAFGNESARSETVSETVVK